MPNLTDIIAPSFYDLHYDITDGKYTHYWLKGGRGSTKSSFISVEIILGMMQNPEANAVAIRKVGLYLKDSVYEQLVWAIEKLGVSHLWKQKLSPLELIYATCRELDRAGMLQCFYADDMVYESTLSDQAIIYMENRFERNINTVMDYIAKIKSMIPFI